MVLRIDDALSGSTYPVSLRCCDSPWSGWDSDAGEEVATGDISLDPSSLPRWIDVPDGAGAAEAIRRLMVAKSSIRPDHVQEIGAWLHRLLDDAGVGAELRRRRARVPEALGPGNGSRLLLDIRNPRMALLPWELLYDGTTKRRPFSEAANPAARISPAFGEFDPPYDCWWPLRILVAVGVPPDDRRNKIEASAEVRAIEDALWPVSPEIDLEILRQPTREELLSELERRRPHVLHVIGHGDDDRGGRLIFQEKDNPDRTWSLRADEVPATLGVPPRLVLLNCCRTDQDAGGGDAAETVWQMADACVAHGVPAVISMQGPIPGPDAVAFSAGFYSALADEHAVDLAFVYGRRRVAASRDDGWRRRESGFPMLTLNRPSAGVLPPRWIPGPEIRDRVQQLEEEEKPGLIDRRRFRRDILEPLDRDAADGRAGAPPPALLGVAGPSAMGKSALVRWAVARQVQRGRRAVYVPLDKSRSCTWLELLCRMCATLKEEATDPTAFDEVAKGLQQLARRPEAAADPFASGRIEVRSDVDREEIAEALAAFVRALKVNASTGPLIIAIDHLEAVPREELEWPLSRLLFNRVTSTGRDAGDTRLLLVRRGETFELPGVEVQSHILLKPFEPEPEEAADDPFLQRLGRQYLFMRFKDPHVVETRLAMVPKSGASGVSAKAVMAVLSFAADVEG